MEPPALGNGNGHHSLATILRGFAADPGQPRLTWYGHERIELSGAVLENWVNKTTNLLVEEFAADHQLVVILDLPPHWRTMVWAMAAWRCGTQVRIPTSDTLPTPDDVDDADAVVVTDRPIAWGEFCDQIVAVTLASLARAFDGPLPGGALDAASDVMTFPDALGPVPSTDPHAFALAYDGVRLPYAELFAGASRPGSGQRTWIRPSSVGDTLRKVIDVWSAGGSVVLTDQAYCDDLDRSTDRLEAFISTEFIESIVR